MSIIDFTKRVEETYDLDMRMQTVPWEPGRVIVNIIFPNQTFTSYLTTETEFQADFQNAYQQWLSTSKNPSTKE